MDMSQIAHCVLGGHLVGSPQSWPPMFPMYLGRHGSVGWQLCEAGRGWVPVLVPGSPPQVWWVRNGSVSWLALCCSDS